MAHYPPRLIRMRDAPIYVGMDRHRFSKLVRPYLTEIPLGKQGIAFDRLEIDAWIEDYVKCNGRRPKLKQVEDDTCQNVTTCQDCALKAISGTLKKDVTAAGSVKARAKLAELKQSNI